MRFFCSSYSRRETGNTAFVSLEGEKEQYVPRFMAAFEELYAPVAPVECRADKIGVQRFDSGEKAWIHLLNYRYDEQADRVLPAESLELTLRDVPGKAPEILVPAGDPVPSYEIRREAEKMVLTLRNAGLYTVVAFG